ncbi:MAG TPA: ParB/Srx family N-terminal domain-containing protein [Chloroflexota bacterium]|nr:ParB/Srx family N-terminal domain-containing protein [Chloroflexota bacterium]
MSPKRSRTRHPRSYEEDAKRLKVQRRHSLGLHPIPVNRVIGSAGKPEQLDEDFKPLLPGWAQHRFQGVLRAAKAGYEFQPISVYKLHDFYYVEDGHNRVAAAKELGQIWIDAYVSEALPKAEGEENLLYYERKHFEEQTGLTRIILKQLGRYGVLLDIIRAYSVLLSTQLGREVDALEAGKVWFREVYVPKAASIRRSHLRRVLRRQTVGDIFFEILELQRERSRTRGRAITFDEAFEQYLEKHPPALPTRVVTKGLEAVKAGPLPIGSRSMPPEADPLPFDSEHAGSG